MRGIDGYTLISKIYDKNGFCWTLTADAGPKDTLVFHEATIEVMAYKSKSKRTKTFVTSDRKWLEKRLDTKLEDLNWYEVEW